MTAKRKAPAGGVGSNQYQTVGASRARPASGRVACFAGTLDAVDATDQFVAGLVEHEGHRCPSCEDLLDPADAEVAVYECGMCGPFRSDESNRCPQCNKFGSKTASTSCPNCEEAFEDGGTGDQVTYWTHPDEPGETFDSIDEARDYDRTREERAERAAVNAAEAEARRERHLTEREARIRAVYDSTAPLRAAPVEKLALVPAELRVGLFGEDDDEADWKMELLASRSYTVTPAEAFTLVGLEPIQDRDPATGRRLDWDTALVRYNEGYDRYLARCAELGVPSLFDHDPDGAPTWQLESSRFGVDTSKLIEASVRIVTRP